MGEVTTSIAINSARNHIWDESAIMQPPELGNMIAWPMKGQSVMGVDSNYLNYWHSWPITAGGYSEIMTLSLPASMNTVSVTWVASCLLTPPIAFTAFVRWLKLPPAPCAEAACFLCPNAVTSPV